MSILTQRAFRAVEALRTFSGTWHVAGGWAIDLFLGKRRRPHKDIDIAIDRKHESLLRDHLAGLLLFRVESGQLVSHSPAAPLPVGCFQIFAQSAEDAPWEFIFEERHGGDWVYRRDPEIRRPKEAAFQLRDGIPYLAPEIVLLFKAKHLDEQNNQDFNEASVAMDEGARYWLRRALRGTIPTHPWIEKLR